MKTHKTIKKLLKQGYENLEIRDNIIYLTVEKTLSGEDLNRFYDDFSPNYYLDYVAGNGAIIITLTKRNN